MAKFQHQNKSPSIHLNFPLKTIHLVSERLLDNPYAYNYVRFFLAGKQIGMKKFISNNLRKYECNSVIDLCCGTGDFAAICPENVDYTGLDINAQFISFANKKFANDKMKVFKVTDVVKFMKRTDERFDCVLLVSAIHHLSDTDLAILLPAVKRIAKKVVIIADIIPDPPHPVQKFFAKIDRGHYVRSKHEKLAILKQYFHVVSTKPIPTRSAVQLGIICTI